MSDQYRPYDPADDSSDETRPIPGDSTAYPPARFPAGHYGSGYYPAQQPPVAQVMPKNPAVSLLLSFFIPGVGSMVNGDVGKGVGILVGYVVSLFLVIILIGLLGVFAFWVWGMVDAYQGARRWNLRHGIMS